MIICCHDSLKRSLRHEMIVWVILSVKVKWLECDKTLEYPVSLENGPKNTEQVWFKTVKINRENVDGKPEIYQITLEISRFKTENPFIVNPWHLSVSIHILHTVLQTFPWVLTRRICLTIKSFFWWWSFPVFLCPSCAIRGWYCKEKLDAGHF